MCIPTDEDSKESKSANSLSNIGENIMRKISRESAKAFVNFEPYKKDNTVVSVSKIDPSLLRRNDLTKIALFNNGKSTQANLFLHGNRIASHALSEFNFEKTSIDLCGYHTRTTRERINGVLDVLGYDFRVAQRNDEQILIRGRYPKRKSDNEQQVLKLSDDSFDPDFAKRVFGSCHFFSGADLGAIQNF